MFKLQDSGTFQLIYDVTNELNSVGKLASREVFLTGNFDLRLEGVQFDTPLAVCDNLANDAISMMIQSPQIINTSTPSNQGFIINGNLLSSVHETTKTSASVNNVLYKLDSNVGDVTKHTVLCNFNSNVFSISLAFANINGYNPLKRCIPFDRSFSDIWKTPTATPLTKPVFLTLTFSYKSLERLV